MIEIVGFPAHIYKSLMRKSFDYMIKEGGRAPDFRLKGVDGKMHSLKDFAKGHLVLYFYPKDLTPGCTIQAKKYSGSIQKLRRLGATVVGVSKDDVELHKKFKKTCGLKILLLSDPTSKTIKKYGAYGDRGIFGMGTLRNTYIIKGGKVAKIFRKVDPTKDANVVIEFVTSSHH